MPEYYIIERSGQLDLSFEGTLLASVSGKKRDDQVAWEDLSLWETVMGQFVIQRIRHDSAFGKTHTAFHGYKAEEILSWLKGEDEYVSDDAKKLLGEAATKNMEFASVSTVRLD